MNAIICSETKEGSLHAECGSSFDMLTNRIQVRVGVFAIFFTGLSRGQIGSPTTIGRFLHGTATSDVHVGKVLFVDAGIGFGVAKKTNSRGAYGVLTKPRALSAFHTDFDLLESYRLF